MSSGSATTAHDGNVMPTRMAAEANGPDCYLASWARNVASGGGLSNRSRAASSCGFPRSPAMIWRIGTAGWSIASQYAGRFPKTGFALERYAQRFACVEVNSSFYRSHRAATWTRWASIVPEDFRFAVKVPRAITHERGLRGCGDLIARLVEETAGLGQKLGVLLVQLPPRLAYQGSVAEDFFTGFAAATRARIVCEPRHASWFEADAEQMLAALEVARVAADPARVAAAALPGGWRGLSYWRLHGSPVMYRSCYGPDRVGAYAALIAREHRGAPPPWCIFDNTAAMAAMGDAFELASQAQSS